MTSHSRVVDSFLKMVQIDSPTGEEDSLADFLVEFLKDKVDRVQKDSYGNIFISVNGSSGEPILLNAHLDTVEPGRGIKPIIDGEFIKSDGTTILGVDDKAGIAGIIEALLQLKEKNLNHRPIEVILTKSEEVGSFGALNFDYSLLKAKSGFCFDYTKPVGAIVRSSPFYERFDLKIIGKAAHASRPDLGINVLLILKDLLQEIEVGVLDDDTILNLGVIKGGAVRNTVPGELLLEGEIRSFVELKLLEHRDHFFEVLKKVIKDHGAKVEIETVRENGGYKYDENFFLIEQAKKAVLAIGREPDVFVHYGVSDANTFAEIGIQMVNLSNGGENAHTVEERIKISEMGKLVELIIELVK